MNTPVVIQIVGAPIACAGGVKDTWREVAAWAASQLQGRFGDVVRVDYYDLFDPACPELPPGVQLPHISARCSTNGETDVDPLIFNPPPAPCPPHPANSTISQQRNNN
jgi:hypothetical protein